MNILVCPNNLFTMPCTVLLCSLLENNNDVENIAIYVLVDGMFKEENKDILRKIISGYENAVITFYTIEDERLNCLMGLDSPIKIPIVAFYRLFMTDILPKDIDRILYLDSDMIVRKSLTTLYQTNLDKKAVAVVLDTFNYSIDIYNNLRYKPSYGYFNSGMLLVNLKYWRENNVLTRCLEFIKSHPERVKYLDQDVLNAVLYNEKIFVPLTNNAQTAFFLRKPPVSWEYQDELDSMVNDPCIVHYTGSFKPWQKEYNLPHPYKSDFFKYQSLTQWANTPLVFKSKKRRSVQETIKSAITFVLRKAGILSAHQSENQFITLR